MASMGKVEKWVVLGVLGLIVGILVVSMTVDDPLSTDGAVLAGGSRAATTPGSGEAEGDLAASRSKDPTAAVGAAPSTLLSASVETAAPTSEPVSEATPVPAGSILLTTEGLQPSYMNDMMFYTWKAGDTFPTLAQRLYGDVARLATLRRVNEGRTDVEPGDRILVPLYDLDAAQPGSTGVAAAMAASPVPAGRSDSRPDSRPDSRIQAAADTGSAVPASPPASAVSASGTGSRLHVVQEGESLWKIAKMELGAGSRWKEIYDANRDQMSSPEALRAGLKLRIP